MDQRSSIAQAFRRREAALEQLDDSRCKSPSSASSSKPSSSAARTLGPTGRGGPRGDLAELARQLLSRRGELSGVAIAQQIVETYGRLTAPEKKAFFHLLATEFGPDVEDVRAAASLFLEDWRRRRAVQAGAAGRGPRREFFRRLNLAPGGTAAMVAMRAELLPLVADDPDPQARSMRTSPTCSTPGSTADSWCCGASTGRRRPISWRKSSSTRRCTKSTTGTTSSAASIPVDRRCFAFFHPALAEEPLIFVEVALIDGGAPSVQALLSEERPPTKPGRPRQSSIRSQTARRG
jgi:malonyl-CoA decarboxylase